jgi:hypothetical protein
VGTGLVVGVRNHCVGTTDRGGVVNDGAFVGVTTGLAVGAVGGPLNPRVGDAIRFGAFVGLATGLDVGAPGLGPFVGVATGLVVGAPTRTGGPVGGGAYVGLDTGAAVSGRHSGFAEPGRSRPQHATPAAANTAARVVIDPSLNANCPHVADVAP